MKLLYAFPEPLPLPRARGIQAVNAVAALAATGVEIDFCFVPCAQGDPFAYYQIAKPESVNLLPLSRALPWPMHRVHSNRFFAARLQRRFNLGQQMIMVRHLKLAAWLANHPSKPKYIYEAHEVFADTAPGAKAQARREEEARVMRSASAVVANCAATAQRLVTLFGSPRVLQVIPNGVNRPEDLSAKNWAKPEAHIVYSGSLFPWKGAHDLVAAARYLPGCRIDIVGGEADRLLELQALVPTSGASIKFAGQLSHRDAMERVMSACIAVLPNRADPDSVFTSPIKLFEYMAAGCAIVASDLPAMREILADDEVMWSKPGDPGSIAEAIKALVGDPARARRMGERVREKSRQYTWQTRAARVMALLSNIGAHP